MTEADLQASTVAVLANATELVASVIEQIAGNEISNHIDGKPVRLVDLTDAVAAKIQSNLAQHIPS
jgi:hypothetical protein